MEHRSRFEVLPARPPTPPRESAMSSDGPELDPPFHVANLSKPALNTPNESPNSATDPPSKSSDRPAKRVDFQLVSSKLATVENSSPHDGGSTKSQPSSRDSRPVKSILKPFTILPSDPLHASTEPRDFPRMLDDFSRQLAASSASSRLDAYMQLNNCLKTYKNMPEQQALREKMPLLATFIERDLQETEVGEGARGTQLATEVVRLVTTLLWSPTMADVLPETFQCFILDRSIAVAGSEGIPKALVNQYLHLLSVQSFRSKFMTSERANRIITQLSKITEHIKGKQVIAHKLEIYKKLIGQARNVMHARFRDWYECLFHGLLAPNQEIRVRALSLAQEAGVEFGASEHVTKAVVNLFNHKVESKDSKFRYGEMFITRFQERLSTKEERQQVPQLWAAVLLFLRHKSRPLERWAYTGEWLRVMQQCLNIGDLDLRLHAIRAWTRWIYVVDPSISTSENMASLLRTPIEKQLDRFRLPEKETKRLRASVIATYTTLLYYAFRPSAAHDVFDRYWPLYVDHFFVRSPQGTVPLDPTTGGTILCSILGDNQQKIWNVSRAVESAPIKADELPRIDPKWVRARAGTVLATLENILLSEEWWSGEVEQTAALRVWRTFTKALGEASRKEVKVSTEAMQAVAEVVSSLMRFFSQTRKSTMPLKALYQRLTALTQTAVQNIGHLPFAEQRLVQAAPEKYSVIATAPGRSHKVSAPQTTAFAGLVDTVMSSVRHGPVSVHASELLELLIRSALRAGSSLESRLNILRSLSSRLRSSTDGSRSSPVKMKLWDLCACCLRQDLELGSSTVAQEGSMLQLHDLRSMAKILELGMEFAGSSWNWTELLAAIRLYVDREAGFTVWMTCIVKPVAEYLTSSLNQPLNETLLEMVSDVLRSATPTKGISDAENPRKDVARALGISTRQRSDIYEPPLKVAGQVLEALYLTEIPLPILTQVDLLDAASQFVTSLPGGHIDPYHFPSPLHIGLAPWFEDHEGLLTVDSSDRTILFDSVLKLWEVVMSDIHMLAAYNQRMLDKVDCIVVAGLSSRHRAIANRAIDLWNQTFGRVGGLEYSSRLENVLLWLSTIAEVAAPCLHSCREATKVPNLVSYYLPTPAGIAELDGDHTGQGIKFCPSPKSSRKPLAALTMNESPMVTPTRTVRDHKAQSTPRLRHDDSQIQFAAITSSPPNIEALESQLLTEHQREVRDRQQAEARAMFPDLRSSPIRKHQDRDLPRLKLSSNEELPASKVEDQHSPTLPPPSETPFLGSSPTPSQRLLSRDRVSVGGRASVESHLAALDERALLPAENPTRSDLSSELQTFGEELLALYEEPIEEIVTFPPSSELLSSEIDSHHVDPPGHSVSELASEENEHLTQGIRRNKSLALEKPAARHQKDSFEESTNETSTSKQEPRPSDEENEIAAQILNDIDRATSMSQNTNSSAIELPSTSRSLRTKRKRAESSGQPHSEGRQHGRGFQTATRLPKALSSPDDDMEDCIVVQSSQSSQSHPKPSRRIETDVPPRRPVKSSPIDESSDRPSSEPVWDVPPTPEVKRRMVTRKRRSPDGAAAVQPAAKKSCTIIPEQEPRTLWAASPSLVTDEIPIEGHFGLVAELPLRDDPVALGFSAVNNIQDQGPILASQSRRGDEAGESVDPPLLQECGVPSPAPSTPQQQAISGVKFLARVRQLLEEAKHVVLGGQGDEIMTGLMDVGREVMEAKRRS